MHDPLHIGARLILYSLGRQSELGSLKETTPDRISFPYELLPARSFVLFPNEKYRILYLPDSNPLHVEANLAWGLFID
jgi:hypothetical protein